MAWQILEGFLLIALVCFVIPMAIVFAVSLFQVVVWHGMMGKPRFPRVDWPPLPVQEPKTSRTDPDIQEWTAAGKMPAGPSN